MHRLLRVLLALGVIGVTAYYLSSRAPGRSLVEQAIAAHGGRAGVERCKIGQVAGTGTGSFHHADEFALTWEETFHLPDKLKRVVKARRLGVPMTMIYLMKDGKVRMRQNDGPIEEHAADDGVVEHWSGILAMLVQLKSEGFELTPLGEVTVLGRPALGVRVVSGEEWKGDLAFDRDSHLLVQSKRQFEMEGQKVSVVTEYRDYRDFDGVQLPRNVVTYRNGLKHFDMMVTDVQFLAQLDEGVFDRLD